MIQTLEELTLSSWPALQNVYYDGWMLRFANGYTRRSNCVMPLYPARLPAEDKIAWCEALYHQRGQPAIFKLAGRSESQELCNLLLAHGYHSDADTSTQTADLHSWASEIPAGVQLAPTITPQWDAAYQAMNNRSDSEQARHRQILAAIALPCCYASIQFEGQVVACALGVLQASWVGIYDVIVHPNQRRQCLGEQLMRALLGWGKQQGALTAYLNVMLNNPPALRLYERLGFREQYQYWYCVK